MDERLVVLEPKNSNFPPVTDYDYDLYEGFDVYKLATMPMFIVDYEYELVVKPRRSDLVYL